ncbi:hypothetical protein ACP4OV_003076 [Aristida adscensionis]
MSSHQASNLAAVVVSSDDQATVAAAPPRRRPPPCPRIQRATPRCRLIERRGGGAPQLPADALCLVFERLPQEPAHLTSVAAVSHGWRGLVHDDAGFLRQFRAAHGGVPPLLGYFTSSIVHQPAAAFTRAMAGDGDGDLATPFSPASSIAHRRKTRVHDVRHGRVLLHAWQGDALIVWDPMTGAEHHFAAPPSYVPGAPLGAALICGAGDHGGDDDCHSAGFRVVVAYRNRLGPQPLVLAAVYSSATSFWGATVSMEIMEAFFDIDLKPSVVLSPGNVVYVYWLVGMGRAIVEFDLAAQSLQLIEPLPLVQEPYFMELMILPMADGRLAVASVVEPVLVVFARQIGGAGAGEWAPHQMIQLDASILTGPMVALDSTDDEDDDDDARWNDIADQGGFVVDDSLWITEAQVAGFAEESNAVLLQSEKGTFMMGLDETLEHRKLSEETTSFSIPL